MTALRAGRALLGLSQGELAALAGVSRQVVVRIEKCEGNVPCRCPSWISARANGPYGYGVRAATVV
ncbi:helix-turn-helix transcriptional regulator [Ensifer sp. LC163]|nr:MULTISPECIES: helix-turn-helix domain-containing protein [unclassified Ensifer]